MSAAQPAPSAHNAQIQRWRFMEAAILWEGSLQRSRVADMFGIAANHVSVDFREYLAQYPNNFTYNVSKHHYEPSPRFKPQLCRGDPAEYLALLQASAQAGEANGIASLPVAQAGQVDAAIVPLPQRVIATENLRAVLAAIRGSSGLKLGYRSLTTGHKNVRELWPHALLHGGRSWYARAYDASHGEYRDYSLGRMADCEVVSTSKPDAASKDVGWTNMHAAEVIPNPAFTAEAQEVIALDYGMKKQGGLWVWRADLRECMVKYFVDWYRLGAHPQPKRHLVVLKNMTQLKPYCFPS